MTQDMSREGVEAVAIHGWGCTPTGDPPPAAVTSEDRPKPKCLPSALIKSWRRTALYAIIIFLMLLVFLNLGLTLWIISTLRLNINGIGPIKIVNGGIRLDEQAWLVDKLLASTITSHPAQPISLHSYRNFTVLVSEPNHVEHAKLLIKRDGIQCSGRMFEIRDSRGGNVFRATREEVRVFADFLAVDGIGGLSVKGAIQTPSVRAPPGSDLQLESLTRGLDLRAPQSIYLESRAGSIDITSQSTFKLTSTVGAVRMDAPNIIIHNLREANVTEKPQKSVRNKVYQLCACASGKLFLAAPDVICATPEGDTELCR